MSFIEWNVLLSILFYFNFKKYRKYLQSFVDWFVFRCFMSISYMCVSVRWKSIRNPVSYNGMVDNKMSRNGIYLSHDKLFVLFDRLMEKGIIKRTTEKSSSKPATAVSSVATRFFFLSSSSPIANSNPNQYSVCRKCN